MWKSFAMLRSAVFRPGPSKAPTGQVPKVPGPGFVTAAGFRKCTPPVNGSKVIGTLDGTPETQFARVENPAVPDKSAAANIVCANPVWKTKLEETRHPPTTKSSARPTLLANCLPRPKGSS